MRLNYSIDGEHAEKFLGFLLLGVLHAIDMKAISIDEAESLIFKPSTSTLLTKAGFSEDIVNIIDYGCELEDIESLIPERLADNVKELMERTLACIQKDIYVAGTVDKSITITK